MPLQILGHRSIETFAGIVGVLFLLDRRLMRRLSRLQQGPWIRRLLNGFLIKVRSATFIYVQDNELPEERNGINSVKNRRVYSRGCRFYLTF